MEKFQQIRTFLANAREYLREKSEQAQNSVQRSLQVVMTADISIFDPGNSAVIEFYITLYELMYDLEPKSPLVWHGIAVLQRICQNTCTRRALIHTYKYTPVLTKLLGAHLIHEKKIKVLQLLQELTYGIKISWREAHLPALVSILTQLVATTEKDVVSFSLAILVNICYKNLPAVYTLMRCIDVKQFLKTIINIQNGNVGIKVHVCKLLIILQETSSEIPESDILNFVNVSFITLGDAFRDKDVFLMRHVVDFFGDVRTNERSKEVVPKYKCYVEDCRQILALIPDDSEEGRGSSDDECIGMVFEFLHSLVSLQMPEMYCLYKDLVCKAMNWMKSESARLQCLNLIHAIVIDRKREINNSRMSFHDDGIVSLLESGLPMMVFIIDSITHEELSQSCKKLGYVGILLQLLKEMSKIELLKIKIFSIIKLQSIRRLFEPLCLVRFEGYDNLLHHDVASFYIRALDFVSSLAPHDAHWLEFSSSLLQHKQVHVMLSAALLTGTETVKKQVLALVGTLSPFEESMCSFAKCLSELEPYVIIPNNGEVITQGIGCSNTLKHHDLGPLFSLSKENRLDALIAKLEEAVRNNKIQDTSTSAIMELYEYKFASMHHSERALQSSLETATNFSTHLQQKLIQVSAETSKLHQLLHQSHQKIEGLVEEKNAVMLALKNAESVAENCHSNFIQEMKNKQAVMTETSSRVKELEQKISLRDEEIKVALQNMETLRNQYEEKVSEINNLESKVKQLTSRNSETEKVICKMEEKLLKRGRLIEEKHTQIIELTSNSEALSEEVKNLNMTVKALEKALQEKEEQMESLQTKNTELSRTIEVISEITTRRKLTG